MRVDRAVLAGIEGANGGVLGVCGDADRCPSSRARNMEGVFNAARRSGYDSERRVSE
jgi:hypothetical protein